MSVSNATHPLGALAVALVSPIDGFVAVEHTLTNPSGWEPALSVIRRVSLAELPAHAWDLPLPVATALHHFAEENAKPPPPWHGSPETGGRWVCQHGRDLTPTRGSGDEDGDCEECQDRQALRLLTSILRDALRAWLSLD